MGTRAVIYTRVSQDRTEQRRSVDEQETECREVCRVNGWTVVEVFSDNDRSASRYARKERPEYKRLRRFLTDGGADVLVLWEGSRAQRDLAAYASLRDLCAERGILYSYSGRTYDLTRTDDRFSTGLDALLAEREADITRDRVLRTVRAQAAAGRPAGKMLYGYRREYRAGRSGPEYERTVIDADRAAIVREAAERVAAGEALYEIAQSFNRRGVPVMRQSATWRPDAIRRMVTNPGYISQRVHRGTVVGPAEWPPILDEGTYAKCAAVLADPGRRTGVDNRVRHLLTGVLRCAVCDSPVRAVATRRGTRVLACPQYHAGLREDVADDFVTRVVVARLSRPDALDVFAAPAADAGAARDRVAELQGEMDDAYALAASGALSARGLAAFEARLLPQIERAGREAVPPSVPPVVRRAAGPDAAARWARFDVADRREVVRALVELRLSPSGRGVRNFDPARFGASRWVGDDRTWAEIGG
jgi:DNA invertase Pin-like site-specific DNA recombinase